jgi:hypothetical protein
MNPERYCVSGQLERPHSRSHISGGQRGNMATRQELPLLPQWLIAGRQEGIPSGIRPFGGSPRDLAVDFRLARRPQLITELLSLCCHAANGQAADQDLFLNTPVGMRIEALLVVATLTDANPFSWRVRCGSASCGQESEFELSADEILSPGEGQREMETTPFTIGAVEGVLRRPTGIEQMAWLTDSAELQCEAMLRSILVRPPLEELLAEGESLESIALAIDEAMDSFDPLLGFHLSVVCPHCGIATDIFPDLAGVALERLSRAQHAVIENVHRLASHYHWSERQIIELPEWRRQFYLELIEGGVQ